MPEQNNAKPMGKRTTYSQNTVVLIGFSLLPQSPPSHASATAWRRDLPLAVALASACVHMKYGVDMESMQKPPTSCVLTVKQQSRQERS